MATIDQVREFWDRRPCNVNHGESAAGSLEWSREITRRKYFVEPHIPEFAQFERWANREVLEIGAGIGTDTIRFLANGASVHGVDISKESLKVAARRIHLHRDSLMNQTNSVALFQMDAERDLPWSQESDGYALVYSFGVLHHTPNPLAVLKKAKMRMADYGELRIMVYARWSLKWLMGMRPEAQAGCPIARRYTEREIRALLAEAGFEVESVEKRHIFPYRVRDYVEHRYVKRWAFRWLSPRAMRWLESILGDHLLVVARKAEA